MSQKSSTKKKSSSTKKKVINEEELNNEIIEMSDNEAIDSPQNEAYAISDNNINQKRKPQQVWEDTDDKDVEVDLSKVARLRKLRKNKEETVVTGEEYQDRLKEYYSKTMTTSHFYDWVNKGVETTEKKEESYLDSILKTNVPIIEGSKTETLPSEIIKLSKAAVLPLESRHNCVIQAIDFHRNNETLLTSGLDKTIKIFNLSKVFETNKYELRPMKTLYTKNLPILTAKFNNSYNEILATGLKKYLLSFDLVKESFDKSSPSFITARLENKIKSFALSPDEQTIALFGHNQYVMMVSAKTKQLLYEFRLNSECSSVCFSPDSDYLFTSTEDGNIYQWDLNTRKIAEMFHDTGSFKTTCIDFSNDGNYLVAGNSAGIANIYGFNKLSKTIDKTLLKEIDNLTTSLDNVKFNPRGEIMAITSKWKRNAIRLVHVPTQTVFSNWPNFRTKLSYLNKVCFSGNSRYMALGNDIGNVIVYNFDHYE